MEEDMKKTVIRIAVAFVTFIAAEVIVQLGYASGSNGLWIQFGLFLVPYLIAGYDVLFSALRGLVRGKFLDENFLMSIATVGAFALVFFPESEPHMAEGAAVMLFFQVGELFQDYAVDKSRESIANMMDIAPEFANIDRDGALVQVSPADVQVGDRIVVKPGERIPLDGTVVQGSSQVDTAALTGESVPQVVEAGAAVISGCVNMTGVLTVEVVKPYEQSTVQRILELVEEASERKARTENFITRFARYYTPTVVGLAVLLAIVPPLFMGQAWSGCVQSALIFLVVSCPCALVISVPLSFFGGIGASSKRGILVKGSGYLEALGGIETVVFDKTGTLTDGTFSVVAVHAQDGTEADELLEYAAHAEAYSDHPIAVSVRESYSGEIDQQQIDEVEELGGKGVKAQVRSSLVLVGNDKLMREHGIDAADCELVGTILHVAVDGAYIGHIVIADIVKEKAQEAISALHSVGVNKCVMLTGDRDEVAAAVAGKLGIDEYHAQLMPQDKVTRVEGLLDELGSGEGDKRRGKLAFVGDGINDAPVLMRADVGIAMGAMGSDAAIEAADVVLMDDDPSKISLAVRIARKTMRIVYQNIVFAIGIKVLIMVLALPMFGIANMWMAVFGDVGVACLAILNATRALRVDR